MRKNLFGLSGLGGLFLFGLLVLGAPATATAVPVNGQPIYVHNHTNRPIWVAANFMPAGSKSRVTDGYWKVEPGQKMLIIYNNAVWIYVHAHDANGAVYRGQGNPIRETLKGKTIDLYPMNTGEDYNPRVIDFFDLNP